MSVCNLWLETMCGFRVCFIAFLHQSSHINSKKFGVNYILFEDFFTFLNNTYNRNLGFIAESIESVNTIYGYVITKLDSKMQMELDYQPSVSKLFTASKEPMYYYYNDKIVDKNGISRPCHVYILSTDTICEDARARNKVFLDIIKNAN